MDDSQFDSLARLIGLGRSRRELLGATAAGSAGLAALALGLPEQGDAKKKRKRKRKKKKRCKKAGAACSSDKQCCPGKSNRICDVPHGASNSDTECCGGNGATCGGVNEDGDALAPFCCVGEAGVREFVCSQNDETNPNVPGTCIPAEVEV